MWQTFTLYLIIMKNYLILGINLLALSFILCLISCEQAQNTSASIKNIVIHDTIVASATSAHVCGATTKTGKPCKKRTKTQFCHLHSK
jgi:hypothetical protein